jgi:cullin-associated NEDD8-dissociated protein 1
VAVGNLQHYLPTLLEHINSSAHEYLVLHALKVAICSGQETLRGYVEHMLPRLFEFAERDEEGVRNVVAECLGKLAAIAPDAVVPALVTRLSHASALTRATVVNSLRFTLTEFASGAPPPRYP